MWIGLGWANFLLTVNSVYAIWAFPRTWHSNIKTYGKSISYSSYGDVLFERFWKINIWITIVIVAYCKFVDERDTAAAVVVVCN